MEIAERHVTIVPRDNHNRAWAKAVTEARQLPQLDGNYGRLRAVRPGTDSAVRHDQHRRLTTTKYSGSHQSAPNGGQLSSAPTEPRSE